MHTHGTIDLSIPDRHGSGRRYISTPQFRQRKIVRTHIFLVLMSSGIEVVVWGVMVDVWVGNVLGLMRDDDDSLRRGFDVL